ncbi:MAG: Mannose-6-phosphate isomerase [Frankiales bacterium]|nr:Mannose-6-phosphate isomerase [Frankiales bacterium]
MTQRPDDVLDDAGLLEQRDPGQMLRAVASGAAQVREAALLAGEAGFAALREEGRPRAVVVCGMGGSAIAGDVLAAVAGTSAPVPVLTHRGYGLPAWVGATDLVVGVSCSGSTEETLSATEEAVRRGCRLLVVGARDSPVEALAQRGRGLFVPVTQGRQPRASVFALSTPLVVAGHVLGLLSAPPEAVEATAVRLEEVAARCRPDADVVVNPAKRLALELSGAVPVLWGTSPMAGTAAYRAACQLNENSKYPATWGVLPEANHNQVVAFDGPFARGLRSDEDLFADPDDDGDGVELPSLHLVLLRDTEEHPQVARRADVSVELARERGIGVSELRAEGETAFERLASLVGLLDWATTYLALAEGNDPTPVDAITALKRRISS